MWVRDGQGKKLLHDSEFNLILVLRPAQILPSQTAGTKYVATATCCCIGTANARRTGQTGRSK
jgi:hypothetical protein